MELCLGENDCFDDDTYGNENQLKAWAADNPELIKAIYTMMMTEPNSVKSECSYHTWADMTKQGGNDAVAVDLWIPREGTIQLQTADEEDEYEIEIQV